MKNSEVTMIQFVDADSQDESLVIVRVTKTAIGLTLALRQHGDIAVFLGVDEAKQLADSLNRAASILQTIPPKRS